MIVESSKKKNSLPYQIPLSDSPIELDSGNVKCTDPLPIIHIPIPSRILVVRGIWLTKMIEWDIGISVAYSLFDVWLINHVLFFGQNWPVYFEP